MKKQPIHNPQLIDLGLPSGTLWAACNVGATSPEHAGLYFAFGETEGFTAEQVENGERVFDKVNYKARNILKNLTLEQDAARANLGGNWQMPTYDEWKELFYNCNVMWTDDYNGTGGKGHILTSKVNRKSVFLPAAGLCYGSSVRGVGSGGDYWSASWKSSSFAWYLGFDSGEQGVYCSSRCCGFTVRGVCKR